jgi:hypothetical protein
MTIESKHVGTVGGFEIDARIVEDEHTSADDYDCYTEDQIAAYRRGDWGFVGTIVTASKAGIELGFDSLWASEHGFIPGVEGFVSPLDGEGDEFVNGYGPQMIREAVEQAEAKLAELTA